MPGGRGSARSVRRAPALPEPSRKHGNPIYNLLPDLLSRLSGDETIEPAAFQRIMTRLLGFIDKDRRDGGAADKFVNRFAEAAADGPNPLATSPSACPSSPSATRRSRSSWSRGSSTSPRCTTRAYASLSAVVAKAKKTFGRKASKAKEGAEDAAKQTIDEFEHKMAAAHLERYESYRSAKRAEGHVFDDDDELLRIPREGGGARGRRRGRRRRIPGALDGATATAAEATPGGRGSRRRRRREPPS